MRLPVLPSWYEKLEVGMTFENCSELAEFLGVNIRPGTNDRQRLMNTVKRYFVIEHLPPKQECSKRSYAFKIVERKEVNMTVTLSMKEYEEYRKLRKGDSE